MADPTVTIELIESELQDLGAKIAAKNAAHDETSAAAQALTDTTNAQQALVDQALANFDVATGQAKAVVAAKQIAEDAAAAAQQTAFDQVLADLQTLKAQS
jgi:hypothetical protein